MIPTHYIPILRGKKAEFDALAGLPANDKQRFTPLIEIARAPLQPLTGAPKKTPDQQIEATTQQLKESWGTESPVFVDAQALSGSWLANGIHPLEALGRSGQAAGIRLIPVTAPDRDPEQQQASVAVARQHGGGICIRLNAGAMLDVDEGIRDPLEELLGTLGMDAPDIDLVLDYADMPFRAHAPIIPLVIQSALQAIPAVDRWRSLTVAASAFPDQLSAFQGFRPGEVVPVPRTEWGIWQTLVDQRQKLPRLPQFGDYGIISAAPMADFDPVKMSTAAKIRYTCRNHWLVIKGASIKKEGCDQYFGLAASLINHPDFCGRDFSPGDEYMFSRGTREAEATCGNQATWIQAGLSHHLTFVARQLASLDGA